MQMSCRTEVYRISIRNSADRNVMVALTSMLLKKVYDNNDIEEEIT
jgi:hypothetical protein